MVYECEMLGQKLGCDRNKLDTQYLRDMT